MPHSIVKIANRLLKIKNYHIARVKPRGPTGVDLEYDLSMLIQKPAPVCLDVGANIGQTIEEFCSWLTEPRIHSFEPSSEIFAELTERKEKAGTAWDNVTLYPFALGESRREATIHNFENSELNSLLELEDVDKNPFRGDIDRLKNTETVSVFTVDEFLKEHEIDHVDMLKIDTQGFDLQVLKGAEQSIVGGKVDYIFLEMNFVAMYKGQGNATELIDYLAGLGQKVIGFYDIYRPRNANTIAWCSTLFGKVQ